MPKAQELGDLVEGLAQRIVDGATPALVIAHPAHEDELAVPARNQQHEIGKGDAVGQPGGQRMRLEVVDRDERLAEPCRKGLGGGEPHEHAPDQPGAGRRGNGVDLVEPEPRLVQRLGDEMVEPFHMRPRRQFGNHAAKGGMFIELRAHHVGTNAPLPGLLPHDDGRGGFVAAGFDTQDDGLRLPAHDELVYSQRHVSVPGGAPTGSGPGRATNARRSTLGLL